VSFLERKEAPYVAATKTLILRRADVCNTVGFSTATLCRLVARGEFPPQRSLGSRAVGWLASEVEAWVKARPVSENMPVARGARA
jgi:prophage regulatory protein